ncbi:MAG: CYTH domain-containing protein [Caldilineaceae bacterium]
MATETERKFLVEGDGWRRGECKTIRQGYLSTEKERVVRVRTMTQAPAGKTSAYLTIKGATTGVSRAEYEYSIPIAEAEELLDQLCQRPLIEKHRYTLNYQGTTWEVDEFFGENQGLVIAEVELEQAGQSFAKPPWVGKEVSDDMRYQNAALVQHPFSQW